MKDVKNNSENKNRVRNKTIISKDIYDDGLDTIYNEKNIMDIITNKKNICIFLLVWFVDSIIVLAIGIFVLFMAGALIFSK